MDNKILEEIKSLYPTNDNEELEVICDGVIKTGSVKNAINRHIQWKINLLNLKISELEDKKIK